MAKEVNFTEASIENAEMIKNQLNEKGFATSLTKGVSMRPMLRQHKDLVIIEKAQDNLKKYDVPLYLRPGTDSLVLHRILKVREKDYVIRGDNTYALEYVPKEYVVGVLKEFYRDGKYVNCESNKFYKFYVFVVTHTYFPRYCWKRIIRPTLGKIKRKIFK